MTNPILWEASREYLGASLLWGFKLQLEEKYKKKFQSYADLHKWSVENLEEFWRELLFWSRIKFEGSPDKVYCKPEGENVGKFFGGLWFPDLKLNYAENLLAHLCEKPVRAFYEKNVLIAELGREELLGAVKVFQEILKGEGIVAGSRVTAFVGNNHLALVAMLATTSLGATWSSCSPDFGEQGVVDRFEQVAPDLFLFDEKSVYNGKEFDLREKARNIYLKLSAKGRNLKKSLSLREMWAKVKNRDAELNDLEFIPVAFSAPLYILFSSGTTGIPKCIVHSVGGTLLQHVKELALHSNIKKDEKFFYYTTTGWMMWNWMISGLFVGAELYLLEGSPLVAEWSLWDFVNENKIQAFGTSARFIATCRNRGMTPKIALPRITFSTGSPLLPEDFDYYYSVIDSTHQSQLASISGGTDIVSCFMLGNPWLPVRRGEIQGAGLAMNIDAFDENGNSFREHEGELVCKTPFPAMPVSFLNDAKNKKLEEAYFLKYPKLWHHGDFITLTREGGIVMHGRSDATLNPGGVRIGTAEIYRVVEQSSEVVDSLVVGKVIEGDEKIVLFVKLKESSLSEELKAQLKKSLREKASPRHVPDYIFSVQEIPYTLSGKKVELAVKKILKGEEVQNTAVLQDPKVLKEYAKFKALIEGATSR